LDARAVGRLKERGIGRGDAVPAQRVEVGREQLGPIEAALGHVLPARAAEDPGVDLTLPQDLERIAERVVFEARERDEGRLAVVAGRGDALDEVLARADADDLAGLELACVAPAVADRGRGFGLASQVSSERG